MVLGRVGWVILVFAARLAAASPEKAMLPAGPESSICVVGRTSDSYFSDRSRVLRFPDGREITVVGLNHGNRDLRGGSADTLSKAKTRQDLSRLLAADPAALTDSREAFRFLRANAKRMGFMAAEAAPTTVSVNLKTYGAIRERFLHLGTLGDDAQILAFGADFYFRLSDRRSPKLIGIEDEALGRAYLQSLPAMEKATAVLKTAKFETETAARLSEFLNSFAVRYATFRPESDASIAEARSKFTAQDFARIEPFLRARLDVMRAMKARDRHDVEQLLAQKASGILLIGSSHLDSIASLLHDACASIGAK